MSDRGASILGHLVWLEDCLVDWLAYATHEPITFESLLELVKGCADPCVWKTRNRLAVDMRLLLKGMMEQELVEVVMFKGKQAAWLCRVGEV